MNSRAALMLVWIFIGFAQARVTRVAIESRESPSYKGQTFGKAGQYEMLRGRFSGDLDPKDPHNALITDIELAPRF